MKVITLILSCLLLIGAAVGITVAAEDVAPAPTVEIAKKNIAYEGAIQMVYLVEANNLQDGQTVAISFNDGEYVKKPAGEIDLGGKTYKAVYSNGIVAKDYRKALEATPVVLDAEGNTVATGAAVNFTAYDYAMTRFDAESISETQFNLYKALLDYSAAVQVVLGFDDETVATVGGWADEYYKLVLNGETTYERGAEFDGILTADRFIEDGAKGFTGWTDGEGNTVVGWTALDVLPGTTVLNKNYAENHADLEKFDDADLANVTTTATDYASKTEGSADTFYKVSDGYFTYEQYNNKGASEEVKFASTSGKVYAEKYVFETDFNFVSADFTGSSWLHAFCLYNGSDQIVNTVVSSIAGSDTHYTFGGLTLEYNTWHHLEMSVEVLDDGALVSNVIVDGYRSSASFQSSVTQKSDYRMTAAVLRGRNNSGAAGICANSVMLLDNMVAYTVGDPVSYDITLDANNGDETTTQNVTMGAEYTLPTPENGGKAFLGWYAGSKLVEQTGTWTYCGASKVDDVTVYGKAPTLTAKWAKSVNVTLDPTYGALPDGVSANMVCTESFDYTLPSPTLEGFSFNGWYYGDTKVENSGAWTLVDAESITLTAKWLYVSKGAEETLTTSGSKYFYVPGYNTAVTVDTGIKYVFSAKYTYNGMSGFNGSGTAEDPFTAYSKNQPQYIKLYGTNTSGVEDKGWADVSSAGGNLVNAEGVVVCENGVLKEGYTNLTEAQVFHSTLTWCGITYEIAKTYDLTITFTKVANGFTIDLRAVAPNGSVQTNSITQTGMINLEYFKWEARSAKNACGSADNTFTTSDTFANARFDTHTFAEEAQVTLDANVGILPEGAATSLKVMTGATYTLPTPTLEGLDFAGWYYGDVKVENTGKWEFAEKEVTLTAKWLKQTDYTYDDVTASRTSGNVLFKLDNYEKEKTWATGSVAIFTTDITYAGAKATGTGTAADPFKATSDTIAYISFDADKSLDDRHKYASLKWDTSKGFVNAAGELVADSDGILNDGVTIADGEAVYPKRVSIDGVIFFEYNETYTTVFTITMGTVTYTDGVASATDATVTITATDEDGNVQKRTCSSGPTTVGNNHCLESFSAYFRGAGTLGGIVFKWENNSMLVSEPISPKTVTLNANGGTLPEGAPESVPVIEGFTEIDVVPTRDGYKFNGWEIGESEAIAQWLKITTYEFDDINDKAPGVWGSAGFILGDFDANKTYAPGTKFVVNTTFTYVGASPASGSGTTEDPYSNKSSSSSATYAAFLGFHGTNSLSTNNRYGVSTLSYGGGTTTEDGVVYWNEAYWGGLTFKRGVSYNLQIVYTVGEVTYNDGSVPTVTGASTYVNILDDEGNVISSSALSGVLSLNKESKPDQFGGFGFYFRYKECIGGLVISMTGNSVEIIEEVTE